MPDVQTVFSADHHLGHRAIIKFQGRPFWECPKHPDLSLKEVLAGIEAGTIDKKDLHLYTDKMNSHLIDAWNEFVHPNARVIYNGDFSFKSGGEDAIADFFSRMHGRDWTFIMGNHDVRNQMETLIDVGKKLRRRVRIVDFGIQIRVDRQKIICCHYALRSWNASHHGSWHVYGHSHGDLEHTPYFKSMDVGVDAANDHHGKGYTPFTFEEIAKIMKAREQLQHHDR